MIRIRARKPRALFPRSLAIAGAIGILIRGSALARAPAVAEAAELLDAPAVQSGGFERVHADTVRFELENALAKGAAVSGSWDGWVAHPLARGADQRLWKARLAVPSGRHLYRFVVDGLPSIDPANLAIDVAGDGGLASVLEGNAPVAGSSRVEEPAIVPAAAPAPALGPLHWGVRYRGLTTQDVVETDIRPVEGLHTLDLPVTAKMRGYGRADLLFGAKARGDTENADVQLLQVGALVRLSRARVRLFRNFTASPSGGAPMPLVATKGRFGHPLGLEAQGASGRLRFGDLRATLLQLEGEGGLLGPAGRLGVAALSGPIGPLRVSWSGARESDRSRRFVLRDEQWEERPAGIDSLMEERTLATGWRLGATVPPADDGGFVAEMAWTSGGSEWRPEARWIAEIAEDLPDDGRTESISVSRRWIVEMGWISPDGLGPFRGLRDGRIGWEGERIDPAGEAVRRADRIDLQLALSRSSWDVVLRVAHRHTSGVDRANDPLLTDWVWRGMVPGVGRATWWELPLLGLGDLTNFSVHASFPADAGEAGAEAALWRCRFETKGWFSGIRAPLLATARCTLERDIGKEFFARADLLAVGRDQPSLDLRSHTLAPFFEVGYRPRSELLLTAGLGVDPLSDDPLTREQIDRGREDFLVDRSGYHSLVALDDRSFSRGVRDADRALAGRMRLGLELIFRFGESRRPILKGAK
ncbi:MAG: hypothetical protein CME06_17615 [Gemmatimonadetes bacterium]|nr:hypothetical protein [Gemmatimonadota bacterium]